MASKKTNQPIVISSQEVLALATIKAAVATTTGTGAVMTGVITFDTEQGKVTATIDQIDAIYAGIVKSWPTIKPVKDQVVAARMAARAEQRVKDREAAQAAKDAEREQARAAKEAEKAKAKAAKEAEKQAAAAAKAKAKADALKAKEEAKKKADMAKAKLAADKLAAKQAEANKK